MKSLLKNIQHAIDVLFYYYYLYYTKPIFSESISSIIFAMAITFSIPVISLSMSLTFLLEYGIYWWLNYLLAVPIFIFTFKYFRKNDRYQKIIDSKPMFFDSHKLSIALIILFEIFLWGFFFIALPIWVKEFRNSI